MNAHARSVAIGAIVAAVGLALFLWTGDVDTPVVTLTKVGVVLMVLGALEVAISLAALVGASRGRGSAA